MSLIELPVSQLRVDTRKEFVAVRPFPKGMYLWPQQCCSLHPSPLHKSLLKAEFTCVENCTSAAIMTPAWSAVTRKGFLN